MSLLAAVIFAGTLRFQEQPLPTALRPGAPKSEELQKFHKPDVKGMSMQVWLDAHKKRMSMLDQSPFRQVEWRNVGPEVQGGRVVDIAMTQTKPRRIFVAFATGGLWVTENLGQTWKPIFDNQSAFGIGDIDITPDGKTIYLGSGEANSQRTSYAGTGMFKSTDGGETWQNIGLTESHHVGRVIVDPKDPNLVYVASLGPLYSQGGERGLYRTSNGGKTWECILKGDERTGCKDIAIDPVNRNVIYASMWERDRRAWNMLESGPGSAVYKTTDGGKSWKKLPGLPSGWDMGRTAIAVSPTAPNNVYAFIDNQGPDLEAGDHDEFRPEGTLTLNRFQRLNEEGLRKVDEKDLITFFRTYLPDNVKPEETAKKFLAGEISLEQISELMRQKNPDVFNAPPNLAEVWWSSNGGSNWKKTRADMGDHGGYYWNEVVVNPHNPSEVYTLGLELLRSRDSGHTWDSIAQGNHVDHHAFFIDPQDPNFMLDGNDGGIYASFDAGETWTHWNNLPVGQFTTIAVDTKPIYNIYGGLQDNGTMRGPSTYRPGISNPNDWKDIGGGDGSALAVDPRNGGDIVYTAYQFGAHTFLNQVTGQRWSARAADIKGEPPLRYNWISPILISRFHPDIIYLGSQRVHRSFNQGKSYTAISPDLTKNLPAGDVPYGTLTTMDESPFHFGMLYVGADDGSVKLTPDGGATWKDIATPAPDRWVTRIIASTHKDGRIYCTQNGYRQDEWTPYVWVSEDNGASWKSIASNLPFECVNTIREDDKNPNLLYVGTDMGVYVSRDRGQSWMTYGTGIPNTPVHDLVIQPQAEDLVVASHARSVWVVSLKPLRQVTDEIWAEEFHSFRTNIPGNRSRWGYERTPPYAEIRTVDYQASWELWTRLAGRGKLSLVDESGKMIVESDVTIINGLNTLKLSLLLKPADPTAPPLYGAPDDPKTATADPYAARRAQYVPAGDYKLVLEIGGKRFEEEVTIR